MKRESGVISMITSIMVSILVITMAMGLVILTTGGTQQASDDELSLRAYAAAEGGVEWAYWDALYGGGTIVNDCSAASTAFLNSPATGDNAITCLKLTNSNNAVIGDLQASGANQVIVTPSGLTGGPSLQDIEVSWLNQSFGDVAFPASGPVTTNYAPGGVVTGNLPAPSANDLPAIELTIVNYNSTGSPNYQFNPGLNGLTGFTVRNVILLPNSSAVTDGMVPAKKIAVQCANAASGYQCNSPSSFTSPSTAVWASNTANAALDSAHGALIYIRALYPDQYPGANGEHYSITLRANNNTVMTVPSQGSTIDVTARSGPVYRRIQAIATPATGQVPAALNYVLFSDNKICKNFSVTPDASGVPQVSSGCPGTP